MDGLECDLRKSFLLFAHRHGARALLIVFSLLATTVAPSFGAEPFPGAEWSRTTPEEAGWDPKIMAEAHDFLKRAGSASA